MTNQTLTEWIAERRAVHAAATEGPWQERGEWRELVAVTKTRKTNSGRKVTAETRPLLGWQEWLDGGYFWKEEDATACTDAHNHLPAFIAMVEAVLGVLNENTPPDPCQPDDPAGMCPDCYLTGEIHRALEAARKAVSGDE